LYEERGPAAASSAAEREEGREEGRKGGGVICQRVQIRDLWAVERQEKEGGEGGREGGREGVRE
jgi:hypothetical protein